MISTNPIINLQSSDHKPTDQTSNHHNNNASNHHSVVVSCVFCIDGTIKGQANWKNFGNQYLLSYLRKLQLLYPNASYRLTPIFFTSLPPTAPPNHSIIQPLPFLDLNQFTLVIQDLLTSKFNSTSPNFNHSADQFTYGGDDPAILEALVRALELLDRNLNSKSARRHSKSQHRYDPDAVHYKHIVVITSTDIGPPGVLYNPKNVIGFDPAIDDLPKTIPILNQKAQYDGVTFHDLAGRYKKDQIGKWNWQEKQIGLLEQKSIILGLISIACTPRLISFIARHLGPHEYHHTRQQSPLRPLFKNHTIIMGGFTGLTSSPLKRAAALSSNSSTPQSLSQTPNLSTSQPFSQTPNLSASKTPISKSGHDDQIVTSNKRLHTESEDNRFQVNSTPAQFSGLTPNQSTSSINRTVFAPSTNNTTDVEFPNIISPIERQRRVGDAPAGQQPNLNSQTLPASMTSTQNATITDTTLAQGLPLLIAGNKLAAAPQATSSINSSANMTPINLGQLFGHSQPPSSSATNTSIDAAPTDDLSRALALLGGSTVGNSAPFLRQNTSIQVKPPNFRPPSQTGQTAQSLTSPQRQPQPSPHQSSSHDSVSQLGQQIQHQMLQKQQQVFHQQLQAKQQQQQQFQQFQQLQESQKQQQQQTLSQLTTTTSHASYHPLISQENSDPLKFSYQQQSIGSSAQAASGLLPPASILSASPSQPRLQSSQVNADSNPSRVINPTHRALMEAAQQKARVELSNIEAKLKAGEISEEQFKVYAMRVKTMVTETLRSYAVNAQVVQNQGQARGGPTPNVRIPTSADGQIVWQGTLLWKLSIPGNESQKREVSIPIGAIANPNHVSTETVRLAALSWPKIWRVDGIRQTNMSELSSQATVCRPSGFSLHLLSKDSHNNNVMISNEDLYIKFCESLGGGMSSMVVFNEMRHGAVLLYNKNLRSLFALVFQRTPLPSTLLPTSSPSVRPSPGMLNQSSYAQTTIGQKQQMMAQQHQHQHKQPSLIQQLQPRQHHQNNLRLNKN
ncbi:hypothetical protein O181_004434 [Austropuccinia psidii MF-1]|uniref:Mediator of RNA polymerase II transcription subunit 25 n=1 Tax=Austropuccinia psidii MF-1 TaxID=1389203 RepID=A0A9Q3BG77_9BASI|nr:hypothetical protein [Austropuccinia psidii MF-1]